MPHRLILDLQPRSPFPFSLQYHEDNRRFLPSFRRYPAMTDLDILKAASRTLASVNPELKLLVLFGSRARGEDDPSSDWDFAFLLTPEGSASQLSDWLPGSELLSPLSQLLHVSEDIIDLVNLKTCSEILAHFVARDGQVIYEKTPGEFAQFQQQALKTREELKAFRQVQRKQVHQALERWGV